MKTKIANILLAFLTIQILYCQENVTFEIRKALELFQKNIFPSLFPFLVLSPFFIHYGFFKIIKKYLGPILKKLFRISENAAYLFFMSLLSGFPSSATNAKNLYEENLITKEEAFHTLLFSHFSNPLFIFSMISIQPKLVLIAHYFSNIIIGLVLRFKKREEKIQKSQVVEKKSFFEVFSASITNAMHNSLFILGVITFFFMINAILDFPITHLLLELSQGLAYTNSLHFSSKIIACIQAFLLSFGGFSVHIQTFGILSKWNMPYFYYLLIRILHGILASSIVFLFF